MARDAGGGAGGLSRVAAPLGNPALNWGGYRIGMGSFRLFGREARPSIVPQPREVQWQRMPIAAHFSVPKQVSLAATWQCDLRDDRLRWSNAVFELFGIAPGTPIARRDVLALYAPESLAELEAVRADAIARCASFTMEAQIRTLDGADRWIRISADIACQDGRPTHLYGLKQDITAEWARRGA